MGWSFRKQKRMGPLNVGLSKGGVSASGGTKRARVGGSTSGRKGASLNLGKGLRWTKSKGR